MKYYKFIIFSLIITCLISWSVSAEPTLDELDKQKEEMQQKIENSKVEIGNKKQEIKKNETKLKGLKNELFITIDSIKEYKKQIEQLETDIVNKEFEIVQIETELKAIEADHNRYMDYLSQRIAMMYELDNVTLLEIMFSAESLEDMMTRMVYVDEIIKYDQLMIDKMKLNQELAQATHEALDLEKTNLDHLVAEATLQKEELESYATETNTKMESTESAIQYIAKTAEELEREVAEELEELKEIEALIEYVKFKNSLKLAGGKFIWPVDGYSYISSYFGTRADPFTGKPATHYGIDIPAPVGTPIFATMAGEVVEAKFTSSYGNKIVIYHGTDDKDRAVTSLYAHNSKLIVTEGQLVKKGDIIAYAGSTGRSTGSHLHFAILVDGVWVDPLTYTPNN